ncbi:5-formyltetrahydrofolate cyclo-ligase [Candidatus Odyssella thessalonicensis]|uniref:5-formyltetrahydrofolate cyclo-ligase n=1 Tax=Candidatus Odyssella thessalonicensis TaxID=84647 RepID=UPI000225C17A|nr:5-formyltetrahydrofolate cyclo-ligase [Candidatus Odyssella thessalonicensis]
MAMDEEKQNLRNYLRQLRRQYHATVDQLIIDQQLITRWQKLTEHLFLDANSIIAGYYAVGTELNILSLLRYLDRQGFCLCLPVLTASHHMAFKAWTPAEVLIPGILKIPEPIPAAPDVVPDIILVPLLGFDAQGNRLGQGKGFYDKVLYEIKANKEIITIGIGYGCQYLDNIMVCDKDYPMDYILTPEKIFVTNKD